eukprot:CAMPEP_0198572264 /NCGR_PEP_ID=MMETSP1462-20131121/111593_1 /TAXON_ID=1333877 /ORGANISM="Brandtodinium nutriculum, Strain RCC3387" /LENGTH=434 /DNA_ID=CAMNT_0044303415 /DNA_START=102 /DNA_END=1403 /DNA_ORIENTATION=-
MAGMAATAPSTFADDAWAFLVATRAELALFCAAVAAYVLLFGNMAPKSKRSRPQKAKQLPAAADGDLGDLGDGSSQVDLKPAQREELERAFNEAFAAGDHRQALSCWSTLRRCEQVPAISLARAVESMQRFKKDPNFVLRELKAYFKRFPSQCDAAVVNDLVESLGKRLDSELLGKVIDMMLSMNLQPDHRTYEVLLAMQFSMRNFSQVRALLGEMGEKGIRMTTRARVVATKTMLKAGSFEEAAHHFRELSSLWECGADGTSAATTTPSAAPQHIVAQLVELACRDHSLSQLLPMLEGVPVSEEAVATMLSECVRRKDTALTAKVEQLVRARGHTLSDATYTLLVKSASGEPERVRRLFNEVKASGPAVSPDFALALLSFCGQTQSGALADELLEHMQPTQMPVLSAFIRFYTEQEEFDKACDVYERRVLPSR